MKAPIGIFSFFSGAGFLDLGFETSGFFDILTANEIHDPFNEIYVHAREEMHRKLPTYGNVQNDIGAFLREKSSWLMEKLDEARNERELIGFIGGPPCPDFSVGGKNKGKDGENGRLSGTYVDLICGNQPDFFLFENVKGLWRTKKHRAFYESLKAKLMQHGYLLTEKLINAIAYGAPQDRERIILIGFRADRLNLGEYADNGTYQLWDFNWQEGTPYRTEDVFKMEWPESDPFVENGSLAIHESILAELTVQYWFEKNAVENHPNQTMFFKPKAGLKKFQTIAEGDDKKKSFKRLHRWRYSPTAAYGNNEVHLHPYQARRISVAEALAIQSLPRDFVLPTTISLTNAFKAIGNGVPFLAAQGLATSIVNFIQCKTSIDLGHHESANRPKHSHVYQPVTSSGQLSIFEP